MFLFHMLEVSKSIKERNIILKIKCVEIYLGSQSTLSFISITFSQGVSYFKRGFYVFSQFAALRLELSPKPLPFLIFRIFILYLILSKYHEVMESISRNYY